MTNTTPDTLTPRIGIHPRDDPAYFNRLNNIAEVKAIWQALNGFTTMRSVDLDWEHWADRLQCVAEELRWGGVVPASEGDGHE